MRRYLAVGCSDARWRWMRSPRARRFAVGVRRHEEMRGGWGPLDAGTVDK
jgi:hypothetical protein